MQAFFFFFFLGQGLQHMEVPRLGVELEVRVRTCTTAHGYARSLIYRERGQGLNLSPHVY